MAFRKSPVKLAGQALWDYALRLLAQRPHSIGELRQKLARRSATPADTAEALEKLREYGLADDGKFSETFATARLQNQGFGKMRVLRDLRTKRVSAKVAEEAIGKVFASTDELVLAADFLQRKYRGKDLPTFLKEDKNLMSAYRRLRMAGFSSSSSMTVLRRYKNDLPEPDETESNESELNQADDSGLD